MKCYLSRLPLSIWGFPASHRSTYVTHVITHVTTTKMCKGWPACTFRALLIIWGFTLPGLIQQEICVKIQNHDDQ